MNKQTNLTDPIHHLANLSDYHPAPNLLSDRVILVTGAGDGIGRVAAKTYAKYGATVILLGDKVKKLTCVYDEITLAGYPEPAIYPFDLTTMNMDDYATLDAVLTKEFGRLDGILHNAALFTSLTPIEHHSMEQWYNTLQVNLNAPFLLTQTTFNLLKKSNDASVIFTLCDESTKKQSNAYWGSYAVSKSALKTLAEIIAEEVETNTTIRVNCIKPSAIATTWRRRTYPGKNLNTLSKAEDIMPFYLYLMGPDSQDVRGETIDVSTNSLGKRD